MDIPPHPTRHARTLESPRSDFGLTPAFISAYFLPCNCKEAREANGIPLLATDADIAAAGLALASGAMDLAALLDWILARR